MMCKTTTRKRKIINEILKLLPYLSLIFLLHHPHKHFIAFDVIILPSFRCKLSPDLFLCEIKLLLCVFYAANICVFNGILVGIEMPK
jgi:hypothetical protein